MIRIYGRTSSINVRKVLWVCHELNIPYEQMAYGMGVASTHTPEYLAMNPNGLIPVIEDGDFVLWESNTICRYLANQYEGARLLPIEPKLRARVEQWVDWQATDLNSAWRYAFVSLIRKSPKHTDPVLLQESIDAWNQKMGILDAHLATTRGYVAGDGLTLADIVLGLSVNRWFLMPMARPELLHINAYYELLKTHAIFRELASNGTV